MMVIRCSSAALQDMRQITVKVALPQALGGRCLVKMVNERAFNRIYEMLYPVNNLQAEQEKSHLVFSTETNKPCIS